MTFGLMQKIKLFIIYFCITVPENDQRSGKRPRRAAAAALLAMLCLLLGVGLTTMGFLCKLLYFLHKHLVVHFSNNYLVILMSAMAVNGVMFHWECVTDTKHDSEKHLALLVTIYNNMTSQLLTQNREVQQRLNNLSKDTDELQKMLRGN